MNVIPAFNCLDEESLSQWIARAGEFLPPGHWVHLDISDGEFTPSLTWNNPARWQELAGQYGWNLEVHLMVESPENVVRAWFETGAMRAILHVETITPESLEAILRISEQYKTDVALSLGLETPIEVLRPYIRAVRYFQVMAIIPGPSGQKFSPLALEKIKLLRALRSNAKIEVDGGINALTAAQCKEAGADFVVAASYIFWGSDAKGAYKELAQI
ncbi:MAG: hypothetical protein AAB602_03435 [Patescibacteria group bacterium]